MILISFILHISVCFSEKVPKFRMATSNHFKQIGAHKVLLLLNIAKFLDKLCEIWMNSILCLAYCINDSYYKMPHDTITVQIYMQFPHDLKCISFGNFSPFFRKSP